MLNALIANEDMTGRYGRRAPALPRNRLARLLSGQNLEWGCGMAIVKM